MTHKKKIYEAKVKVLETDFADMKIGQKMAIGTPDMIRDIVSKVPRGRSFSLKQLREQIAKKLKAEVACPVTTSIYLRLAIEDEMKNRPIGKDFPFWRVVSPNMPLFKKLTKSLQDLILQKRKSEDLV